MADGFILKKDEDRSALIKRITSFLELLSQDRTWEVDVKQYRAKRSEIQNNALWGVAYKVISEHTGYDPAELHDYYLGERFGWVVKTMFGQKKRVPNRRSRKLKTNEFAEFYSFVQRRAATDVGIYVPDPDPRLRSYGIRRKAA